LVEIARTEHTPLRVFLVETIKTGLFFHISGSRTSFQKSHQKMARTRGAAEMEGLIY